MLVPLADNHSSAATWPVSAQLFRLPVSPARVHSCQYLSVRCIAQRAEPCLTVSTCTTILLSVHLFPLRAGRCLALFSSVVDPLYRLASRNDWMQYDGEQK